MPSKNIQKNKKIYDTCKELLVKSVNSSVYTIFLIGNGNNGKSYLTNECIQILKDNKIQTFLMKI